MRIGIFTNCYLPMVNGVVGTVTLLRLGFEAAGHEVYIFAPAFDDYVDAEQRVYRYPAVDLTRDVKYPVAIPYAPHLRETLKHLQLDVIHCHHPFVLGPLGLRVARRKRIPAVYTFHTQYEQYSHYIPLPGKLVNRISRAKIRGFCERVDRITTPAPSARELLLSYGVTRPIRVIPNPTLLASGITNGESIRARYGLEGRKLLINVGRIAAEKNLELLLESFRYLKEHSAKDAVSLMIVGDGPELERLRQYAKELGLGKDVIFTGLISPKDIPQYLAAADLFVMTSSSEVKPLSQLEALAAGVPLVSVKAPGANDTIIHDQNGLLLNPDPAEIGEAVARLLQDEERMARYKKGALDTAEGYSHTKVANQYLELFEQAIRDER